MVVLCAGDWTQNRLLTHIRNVWRYKDEVRVVSLLPYCTVDWFRQFRVVDEWQSVWICPLFDRFSVAIRCGSIPRGYCGCWNLLLRCEAWFFVPVEGLGMVQVVVCTGSVQRQREAPVMNSTFSSSHTEMLFTVRPSLTKTELPCLLCGRSTTSVIPGIFGLAWSLARCVSWRHRQWQCYILHNSDSTVIALERLWLCTADMVWGIIHKFDVLEDSVNNLTKWIGLVVL